MAVSDDDLIIVDTLRAQHAHAGHVEEAAALAKVMPSRYPTSVTDDELMILDALLAQHIRVGNFDQAVALANVVPGGRDSFIYYAAKMGRRNYVEYAQAYLNVSRRASAQAADELAYLEEKYNE